MTIPPVEEASGTVVGIFVGKPQDRWPGKPPSAIGKQPADGPMRIDGHGFVEDEQADLAVHGGPEKAIHHYASEHMDFWRGRFPDSAEQFRPGCFGENISTTGLTEQTLCLGDVLTLGTARVQVCQGRQPCWKLNAHTGLEQMAIEFQKTARTGWYYRVLENGRIAIGDRLELLERTHAEWPLEKLIAARFDPKLDRDVAAGLSRVQVLSQNWREAFAKKSQRGFVENTDRRLKGIS